MKALTLLVLGELSQLVFELQQITKRAMLSGFADFGHSLFIQIQFHQLGHSLPGAIAEKEEGQRDWPQDGC